MINLQHIPSVLYIIHYVNYSTNTVFPLSCRAATNMATCPTQSSVYKATSSADWTTVYWPGPRLWPQPTSQRAGRLRRWSSRTSTATRTCRRTARRPPPAARCRPSTASARGRACWIRSRPVWVCRWGPCRRRRQPRSTVDQAAGRAGRAAVGRAVLSGRRTATRRTRRLRCTLPCTVMPA